MAEVLNSVVDAIGGTPLVRLDRLTAQAGVKGGIIAKLEYLNPGFSKKDRAALGIIDEAERSGAIKPGKRWSSLPPETWARASRSSVRSGATPSSP
ncbi:pyridoxal-phosphate dependent enzyme [Mesorhizobium sp. MSK_1335]|uniref:Pyridoxal-phosphate dependent enzyme n=1 Tax=Mesorhizobium montanum TaxID=3072323 RepID=A0ABU4ZLF9_9HYPH|nr:pyridoxal-phosphate dependent enzyme [Mesorhizobium sp. MSK_1335]MDX8526203.1 pyridoxal-phosphate dependent enzyme [Mesorhizobium sp. MSK_1335]